VSGLTGADRRTIDQAREIAEVSITDLPAYTGETDLSTAIFVAFARAQWELNELVAIIGRLGDGGAA